MIRETEFMIRCIKHAPCDQANLRHVGALLVLAEHTSPIEFRTLAKHMGIPKPSLTRILDTLSKEELIERRRNAHDARTCNVALTATGRRIVTRLVPTLERAA